MSDLAAGLVTVMILAWVYPYGIYPMTMMVLGALDRAPDSGESVGDDAFGDGWPSVSVSLPAYNEATSIRRTLEALLALDYPEDRLQILVISDASDDGTDEIVREYADRGVQLLRLEERHGKTAAENAGASRLRGEIVVNTDASVQVPPGSLKPLAAAFRDSSVGVASGRDVSVRADEAEASAGEGSYVGYEMWLRELETRVGSIVGASGSFYAIRRELHLPPVEPQLSRDFAAALRAREAGYRAVSVADAVCRVPRSASLRKEFRRKVRTMVRGIQTLLNYRHLLNPFQHGVFAYSLASHKLARWIAPLTVPLGLVGLALGGADSALAALAFLLLCALLVAGALAAVRDRTPSGAMDRAMNTLGFGVLAAGAALVAWATVVAGDSYAVWRPTSRGSGGQA